MKNKGFMNIERKYELLDGVFRSSINGIGIIDIDKQSCNFVYVNSALVKMTGYDYDEMVGRSRTMLRGEKTDPIAAQMIDEAVAEGDEIEVELVYYKKDGTPFLCHLVLTPIFDFDDKDKLIYYVAIYRDLTIRVQMEQLEADVSDGKKLLEEYKEAIDAASIVSKTDSTGIITYANDEFCRVSGYTKEELLGNPHNIVRSPNMPKEVFADLWATILDKRTWKGIVENRKKDGGSYFVDATIKPILNRFGEIIEFISIRHEITELIKAKKEAQEALQTKSSFFANASHELRTPLNAIINFVETVNEEFDEMLTDKDVRETNRDFLKRIERNARHLLSLINDVLDISKLEAQKNSLEMQTSDIRNILRNAYESTQSLASKAGLEFRILLPNTPLNASVNARNFLQVVINLLSNAFKFTKEGSVEIFAAESTDTIFVEIRDSGRGIPQDRLKDVFEPFVQVDSFDVGTGLGLKIVKEMCKAMSIEIDVSSRENVGTIFTLKLNKAVGS